MDDGDFGAPFFEIRFAARFLACFLRALNCRSICTRDNLRVMWSSSKDSPLSNHDRTVLLTLTRDYGVGLVSPPHPRGYHGTAFHERGSALHLGPSVSLPGRIVLWICHRVGWPCQWPSSTLATVYAGYQSDSTSPWIGEWYNFSHNVDRVFWQFAAAVTQQIRIEHTQLFDVGLYCPRGV